jgi:hypothetical protein
MAFFKNFTKNHSSFKADFLSKFLINLRMETKRLTLYVDTSVIGGYFDVEFTSTLFDTLPNSKYDIIYSSVTEDELLNAPKQVKNFWKPLRIILIEL